MEAVSALGAVAGMPAGYAVKLAGISSSDSSRKSFSTKCATRHSLAMACLQAKEFQICQPHLRADSVLLKCNPMIVPSHVLP